MRKFHRVFAMILALVTVWTVIPMSVFADTWVEIETENKTEGDVSSTEITLSVDPEALISYLKNGDKAGLLEGISLGGLRDALDADALIEIFSEPELREIFEMILDEIGVDQLLQYVDVDELIELADVDALVEKIKTLPNLQKYVLNYDKLMTYLDEGDLANAIGFVNTKALIDAHVDELVDLTIHLDATTLARLVDISEVVELEGIDFAGALNLSYLETDVGYDNLFNVYIDHDAMVDYLHHRFHDIKHELHTYVVRADMEKFLAAHGKEIIPYLELTKLQTMLASKVSDYATLKKYLNLAELYALVRGMSYTSLDEYVEEEEVRDILVEKDEHGVRLIDPKKLVDCVTVHHNAIYMDALQDSSLFSESVKNALLDANLIDANGNVIDKTAAAQLILNQDLITPSDLVAQELVDLNLCTLHVDKLLTAKDPDTGDLLLTDEILDKLVEEGAVKVREMVSPSDPAKAPLFTLDTLNEKHAINITLMLTGDEEKNVPKLFDVDELEDAEVIDLELALVGRPDPDPEKNLPGLNPDWLINDDYHVFDLRAMISASAAHPKPLFTLKELAANHVIIKLHDMGVQYGYDNIVDVKALQDQILALPDKDKKALVDCLAEPTGVTAIRTVGVKTALEATGETYASIIEKYVLDEGKFFDALGVKNILIKISEKGEMGVIFDLPALVKAIGIPALLEVVDLRGAIELVLKSGSLKEIVKSIDPDVYVSTLTYAMGVLEKNIHEISLDGVVLTEKDGTLLFIDPSLAVDTVLDEVLPELDDLVNMGDDGVVFTTSISVTYASEDTDWAKKTRLITVNAVLESGVDRVRAAATRIKTLLEKFLIHDFNDGILSLDLRLPSQFATALRVALEKLSAAGDPALEDLKNEILDLYDANVNDVSAFLGSLTLEQIVALLNLVDASKFSDAYGKVMTNRYVGILLDYVKSATGQDFTDLTPEDLLIKAGELPTLDVLCEKLEARLGREIPQLDRLPEQSPAEILERLAARAGLELDVKELIEKAAATEDPLAALYGEFVARIEDSGDAYEAIRSRVVRVLDRLLESRVGEKLSALHLDDLYDGDGIFKYAKSVAVDPMTAIRRVTEKAVSLLDAKTPFSKEQIEQATNILLSYFKDGTELTFGVDATLRAEDIYRIEFFEQGETALLPIRTAFLPAGTDLATVQPYEPSDGHVFLGWKDPVSGEIYETMPEKDVQVVAELDDAKYSVYFYADGKLIGDFITVNAGEKLSAYKAQMNDIVRKYLKQQIPDGNIEWKSYPSGVDFDAWDAPIDGDVSLTWAHFFDVTVLDPDTNTTVDSLRVPAGDKLNLYRSDLNEIVKSELSATHPNLADGNIVWFDDADQQIDFDSATVTAPMSVTWKLGFKVEVYAPDSLGGGLLDTLPVLDGHKISDEDYDALRALIRSTYYPNNTELPDGDIILITMTGDNFGTPTITGDVKITWRLAEYYDVEILYKETGSDAWSSETFVAREGNIFYTGWSEYANILALRDRVAGPAPEDYEYIWLTVDENGNVTDEKFLEQTAITKDLRLTWELRYNAVRYSVSIVDPADPETVLWSADGLKNKTKLIAYLSEQIYGDTDQNVWEWLQALVAAQDPHIEDYVHEYRFSWRQCYAGGGSSELMLNDQYELGGNLVLTWKYTRVYDNVALGVLGAKPYTGNPEVDDYAILQDENDDWVIRFKDHWFEGRPTEFMMAADFFVNALDSGHGVRFDATASAQEIVLSPALLARLYATAMAQGVDVNGITLRYAPDEGKNVFDFGGSGSTFFTLDFYVNGSENGSVLKLGDFGTANDPENGVVADVAITLPFADIVANGNGIKTFVCFEEEGANGARYAKYELASYDLDAKTVSFYAPHFSSVSISNQYKISTRMPHLIQSGIAAELLAKLPTNEDIAFYPIDLSVDEYYPAGALIPIRGIEGKDDHLTKIDVTRTLVFNYSGEQLGALPKSGTYTMPAQPIELCFEIAPKMYYVYYYVDGALKSDLTQVYTAYMIETPEEADALRKKILSLEPLGEGYTEADGWNWNGYDDRLLGEANMYLSLVCSTSEESVGEKTVHVIYYAEDGVTEIRRATYKMSALLDLSAIPSVESILGPDTDATRTAYWINVADGVRVPTGYTSQEWRALVEAGETISLRVAYVYRSFVIQTDGNVKVFVGENETGTAQRGAEITVSLAKTVAGKTPTILVKTASGEILVKSVGEEDVSFVMPAEDVVISVAYTVSNTDFTDPDGNVQSGTLGELKQLPPVVIEQGMSIDLTKVPAELILVSAVTKGNSLVLTYQYAVTENVDAKALLDALLGAIEPIEYQDLFVINGKVFASAEDALAYIGECASFKDWSDTVDKNLHFGAFEQATEDGFPWILILILSILLLLILLIVLFYVLYIKGVLKPNAFLKVITVIVSAFFAVCVALAKAWLAVLRLFGIDEDRLVRRYPMLKKRGKGVTLEDTLEALKDADPSYDRIAGEIAASQIECKTAEVLEELEISDDPETAEAETAETETAEAEADETETAEDSSSEN